MFNWLPSFLDPVKGTPELTFINYIYAREITNGMWFLASMFLLASMIKFIVLKAPNWRILQWPVHMKLAWGITFLAAGNMLRAGWIWAILIANSLGDQDAVLIIQSLSFISYMAIAFGVWGCVCTVKAITEAAREASHRGTPWAYWIIVVGVTIGLPLFIGGAI